MQIQKLAAVGVFFGCFAGVSSHSNAQEREKERDADGIYKAPTCDYEFRIKNSKRIMLDRVPTGIAASNSKWEMEIYANSKNGGWSLVGKSKDPSAGLQSTWCTLASGFETPYQQETWFRLYFKNSLSSRAGEEAKGQPIGTNAGAARVASELVDAASPTKESKQQFFQRFGSSYRRLAETELMAQEVAGNAWRKMSPSQQAEFTQLYEKIVMATLHGAYDAALPAQFTLVDEGPLRSEPGRNTARCSLLQKISCNFYAAETKANDVSVEYRLIETKRGWKVVDLLINAQSVQESYTASMQEVFKFGTESALEKLRARVSQY